MPDVPFHLRLLVLVLLLGAVALIDRLRKGESATKWREYGFLLATGLLGGLFGALCDQVSVTLSPEYFVVGKGLDPGGGLRLAAAYLGFQAGFVAGVIAGGVLLLANNPRPGRAALPPRRLTYQALLPLLGAVSLGLAGLLLGPLDPLDLRQQLAGLTSNGRVEPFLRVRGFHAGLYLGALLGLVLGVVRVRRLRARWADAANQPRR